MLMGCSDLDFPLAKSTTGRMPTVAEVPDADETVRGADDPPIVTLEVAARFQERSLSRTQELSSTIIVPNTNLNGVPVTAALQAILDGTDISLSWGAGAYEERLVTVMNLSGALNSVVKKICTSAKLFCSYRNGLLELKEKETFIIDLPAVPTSSGVTSGAANSMADTIKSLAGGDVKVDHQGGNLIYTTDVDNYERVHEYLDQLRHGRPLVVMKLYIWEVTLTNDNATGINWSQFDLGQFGGDFQSLTQTASSAFTAVQNPGVSIGATLSGKVEADAVLSFLNKQGQVQTISNPQLTFVSGSKAEFRVGGEERYISEIGNTNDVTGSDSTSTVTTDSIETGLTVITSGVYENGVLSAVLEITTQDVISLNPTDAGDDRTINLPETSERKIQTSIRVRPGDNLVLAGLVTSRDQNDREGMPLPFGLSMPQYKNDELKNTELVILVKPSIVKFAVKTEKPKPQQMPLDQFDPLDPFLDNQEAFIIDKNGSHTVTIPKDTVSVLPDVEYKTAEEELKPVKTVTLPSKNEVHLPDPNDPQIDKRLMQRGFSHAYDEMRDPVSDSTRGVK